MSILLSSNYWKAILLLVTTASLKQNRNTFLGSIWSLIQPFIHITVISFFFGLLLRQPAEVMVSNLVGALPFWTFIMSSCTIAAYSLTTREAALKRAFISKTYFPIADILSNLSQLALSFVAMYVAMAMFYPEKFSIYVLLVPVVMLPMVISVVTVGIALAFTTPYIRDIPRLVEVILGVVYWTIPIIYPISLIPENKRIYFDYHPLYQLIKPMQDIVVTGHPSSYITIIKSWVICILCAGFSYLIYKKLSRKVIYYL